MFKKSLLMMLLIALVMPLAMNAQNSIPFNEGFESMTSADDLTAAGWTMESDDSGFFLAIETGASNVYEGSKSLNFDGWDASSNSNFAYLGLPIMNASINTLQISFAYKVSTYINSVDVGYLTDADDFSTFVSLEQFGGTGSFTTKTVKLSEAPATAARIAIKYTGWYRLYLDSFEVGLAPSCAAATSITASNITATSATIAWEGEVGDYWNLNYNGTVVNNISALTYNLTGLTEGTNYTVKVQNVCSNGATTEWISTTFRTPEICPENTVCVGEGTATSNFLPGNMYYYNSLTEQIYTAEELGEAGAIESIAFYSVQDQTKAHTFDIYMVATDKEAFESATDWIAVSSSDLVGSATVTLTAGWNTFVLDNPFVYNGTSNVALIVDATATEYENGMYFYVYDAPTSNQAIRIYSDGTNYDPTAPSYTGTLMSVKNRLRVGMGEPPACPKPTGLAVNYEGGTSATFTWTENGTATSWDLQYSTDAEFTEYTSAQVDGTPSFELTGLELATTYYVRVNAFCDAPSEYSNTLSFTTDACMPENQMVFHYQLNDSYGDGWNGNYILVVDETCTIVETLTLSSGSTGTGTIRVCGSYAQFLWYKGSYPGETSWTFTDGNGNELFSGAGSTSMNTYDVIYTYDLNPYTTPTDLVASEVGPHSVTLSWTETGTATAWQIMLDEDVENLIDANSNPFVLTGLDPETEYYAQVRAVGTNGTSLWTCVGVEFTTTEACPNPTDLNVTQITANSANLNWTAYGELFNVNYRPVAHGEVLESINFEDSSMGNWTTIDADGDGYDWVLGSACGGIYLVETGSLAGSGHEGSTADLVTSGSYSNYTSSALTPDNYLVSPQVVLGGTISFWACGQDASYVAEHFGVAVSTTGNTDADDFTTIQEWTMSAKSVGASVNPGTTRSGNRTQGSWHQYVVDLSAYAGERGYVAIRHFGCTDMFMLNVDDITIEGAGSSEWISVTVDENHVAIDNLSPETEYEWQVQANCGDDGTSGWTFGTFTTGSYCDTPYELSANVNFVSATLDWVSALTNYNVNYRPYIPATVLAEQNFDDSNMGDWTTIDADGDGYDWVLGSAAGGIYLVEGGSLAGSGHNASADLITSGSYSNYDTLALTPDNYLVSPQIELGGIISFWACGQDASYVAEHFGVAVSTTGNTDADDFTTIQEWTMTAKSMGAPTNPGTTRSGNRAQGTWYQYSVDLKAYAGEIGYVAIRHFGCTDMFMLNVDDIVITAADVENPWFEVNGVGKPVTLANLIPETTYEWMVQGVNCDGEGSNTEWSEIAMFQTGEFAQSFDLIAGSNWFSTYMDITLDDLKAALVASGVAAPITIKSKTASTTYNGTRWRGTLNTYDPTQMYMIQVDSPCQFALPGNAINPAELVITIKNGPNWIAFPFAENMSVTNAFAGFAVSGDVVKAKATSSTYNGTRWRGNLNNLEPGQGYIYNSNAAENRTFVYPIYK